MKALLAIFVAQSLSLAVFGQGTIIFNNRTTAGDAPVILADGVSGPGAVTGSGYGIGPFYAELDLVGLNGALTPIADTTFRTSPAAATFYFNPIVVEVRGIPPGGSGVFEVRIFSGPLFSRDPSYLAYSNPVLVAGLGGDPGNGQPPMPPPDLSGLEPIYVIPVPEPSTLAFALPIAALLGVQAAMRKRTVGVR